MNWLHRLIEPQAIEKWSNPEDEEAFRKERRRLSENHYNRAQAIAAWLLATLVAVNGGALAADLAKDHPSSFVIGVILAILSGFASWQERRIGPDCITSRAFRRRRALLTETGHTLDGAGDRLRFALRQEA
jgi:hypothetical protein